MAAIAPFVDRPYKTKELGDLADAPVDALRGVSQDDAVLLQSSLNIRTVRDLAANKYVTWAQGIIALSGSTGAAAGIPNLVAGAYAGKTFGELANAPVDALQGISEEDAAALHKAFGIKTVRDLAMNKYVKWAQAIIALSQPLYSEQEETLLAQLRQRGSALLASYGAVTPRNRPEDWAAIREEVERAIAEEVMSETL